MYARTIDVKIKRCILNFQIAAAIYAMSVKIIAFTAAREASASTNTQITAGIYRTRVLFIGVIVDNFIFAN